MKKIMGTILGSALVLSATVGVFASNNATIGNGTGSGSVVIDVNADNLEALEYEYVYDSTGDRALYWGHGITGMLVKSTALPYSPYEGRASVNNGAGTYETGDWVVAGDVSEASVIATPNGNQAYYDYR